MSEWKGINHLPSQHPFTVQKVKNNGVSLTLFNEGQTKMGGRHYGGSGMGITIININIREFGLTEDGICKPQHSIVYICVVICDDCTIKRVLSQSRGSINTTYCGKQNS